MFEAFMALCLVAQATVCQEVLLPGYGHITEADCRASLAAQPPQQAIANEAALVVAGTPYCAEASSLLSFTEVADGVFVHVGQVADATPENRGDIANIGFIIGEQSIAVIDSGGSRWVGEQVYLALRARSALPVSHLILTHMHPDHVLGAAIFQDLGATVVGHQHLPEALAARAETYIANFTRLLGEQQMVAPRVVMPSDLVSGQTTIDLGRRVLQLNAWEMAHSPTDLTVLDRTSATLFTGDLLFSRHIPVIDGSLLGWQRVMAELLSLSASQVVPRQVIPGHGGPVLPWPGGEVDQQRYLAVLASDTRAAIAQGLRLSEAVRQNGQSEAQNWQLFDLFNARNATVAYSELEWE